MGRRSGQCTEIWRREVGGDLETRRKRGAGRWTGWATERGGVKRGGAGHAEKGGGGTVGSPRMRHLEKTEKQHQCGTERPGRGVLCALGKWEWGQRWRPNGEEVMEF